MSRFTPWWCALVLCGALVGCDEVGERERGVPGEGAGQGQTGLSMLLAVQGPSDVRAMRYEVRRCGESEAVLEELRLLEDLQLPGEIPEFVDSPLDEDSEHMFADYFAVLEAGCYDVTITPMRGRNTPSEKCSAASAEDVEVDEGATTEILIISQCEGEETGALDVIATLNHPPEIKKLTYHPGKFMTCPATLKLCATVRDPDQDPVRLTWKQLSGPEVESGPEVIHRYTYHGKTVECVRYELEDVSANYYFGVKVQDLFHLDDELVTAEEWYAEMGYGQVRSRATLKFPAYVSCPSEPDAGDDVGTDVGGEFDVGEDVGTDVGGEFDAGDDTGGEPDVGEPDVGEPDVGEPDVCEPDVGEPDVGEPDVGEPGEVCPRTRGYWQNHNRFLTGNQYYPWPIDEDTPLCGETWLDILGQQPMGDAWYILAPQFIAASLNVADGAFARPAVIAALAQAETLLEQCNEIPPASADGAVATALGAILDAFNRGLLTECEDNDDDDDD